MSITLSAKGVLSMGDCANPSKSYREISFGAGSSGCSLSPSENYQNHLETNVSVSGTIGVNWEVLPTASLTEIELIHANSTAPIRFRYTFSDLSTRESADFSGLVLAQFDRNNAPTQIEVSGTARISLFVAGKE